ncbi:7tm 2 domain containing protein, partial [Asbolus verrucosus]
RWRSNSGNLILLNFVFAMMLQLGLFYVSSLINKNSDDYLLCTVIGVVLHYSIISEFCWMFVIAVLQFKRFVEVLGGPPKWILLKGCFCGWILPLIPVAAVFLWNPNNYVNGNVGLCYPSDLGLYLGVWLPVSIIVVINFVIFLFIVYSVVHRKTECGDVVNNEMMFQWRLAFLLFFMLGLTWAFGFLSELDYGEIFVYLFCATATLQGFVMFLFFIVFNLCVNKSEDLSFSGCSKGCWREEPECRFLQSENPPQCPESFIDSSQPNMCYKISNDKSKFPPKCPFEDVLPFNYYKDVIDNIGPVWMPVRRDLSNGLGFLQWIEASSLYKTEFKKKTPNGTYIWSHSKQEINYTYWSTDAVFDNGLLYGASTPNGWILTEEPASCCLFEKNVEKIEPELKLMFFYSTHNLNLIVTNPQGLKRVNSEFLMYCFTDADARNLLHRYPSLNQTLVADNTIIFTFELHKNGPGRYWCEAFKNFDLEVVRSNEILFRESAYFYYEFMTILQVSYSQTLVPFNPLSSDIINFLEEFFSEINSISYLKDNYFARFMKILDIDEMKNEVLINIHLTHVSKDTETNHDEEYQSVKMQIQKAIQDTVAMKIEMVNFLSSDYCMETIALQLTWPTTPLGFSVHSKEYCFKSDAARLTSLCAGDFINGAQWSVTDEECEIFNRSSVTQTL